jgi:hypothetical protein
VPDIAIDAGVVKSDEKLEALAQKIERLETTAILQIASEAARIHEVFRYRRDEGGYAGYMKRRLGYSTSSAYRLLDVHKRFGTNVSQIWERLPVSAVYQLAASSTPEGALDEVTARVEAGEKITCAVVTEVIARAKGDGPVDQGDDDEKAGVPDAGGDADAAASAERRKAEFAALEADIGAPIEGEAPSPSTKPEPRAPARAPNRPAKGKQASELNSLIWSEATPDQRQHFIDGIGMVSLVAAIPPTWTIDTLITHLFQRLRPTDQARLLDQLRKKRLILNLEAVSAATPKEEQGHRGNGSPA